MPNISARPLAKTDLDAVRELDKISDWTLAPCVDDIDDYNDYSWGIFIDDTLIGYCTIGYADDVPPSIENHPAYKSHDDSYMLGDVFIEPSHRHKGYGQKLIKDTIAGRFKLEAKLPVFLEVMQDNLKYFYGKLGFEEIKYEDEDYCMVFIP